jgi:hypothetical protein
MQSQEEMITASQAINAFRDAGLSEPTFRRRVREGKIKGHLPEGRKRGALYPRSQVLTAIGEAASSEESNKSKRYRLHRNDLKPAMFINATPQDMPEMADLLESLFDGRPNIERWSAWMERNPEIGYILRSDGKVVGCGLIVPLSMEKIQYILSEEVTPPTYPNEILLYEPGKPVNLYVRSIGVLQQGVSAKQRKYWAERLLLGLSKVVVGLGTKGVVIEKLYGRSDTKAGERTMRIMGFTQIPTITSHKNFVIDIATSGLELVLRYKKALNAWRARYEGVN